jgi:hypothetical protein
MPVRCNMPMTCKYPRSTALFLVNGAAAPPFASSPSRSRPGDLPPRAGVVRERNGKEGCASAAREPLSRWARWAFACTEYSCKVAKHNNWPLADGVVELRHFHRVGQVCPQGPAASGGGWWVVEGGRWAPVGTKLSCWTAGATVELPPFNASPSGR